MEKNKRSVKIFSGTSYEQLQRSINHFLLKDDSTNRYIEDIRYSTCADERYIYYSVLILYVILEKE